MAHLDFREAFATSEEKVFPTAGPVAAVVPSVTPVSAFTDFLKALRLSRSTWANIVFVAIASVGGLACAFYFFNGGELLRAAASWPSEYLYPRPVFDDRLLTAEQPNPVDSFVSSADETQTSKTNDAKNLSRTNSTPAEFAPFASTSGLTTPPVSSAPPPVTIGPPPITIEPPPVVPVLPVPPVVPPQSGSVVDQVSDNVNTTVNDGRSLLQSFVQDPAGTTRNTVATTSSVVPKTVKRTTASTRRKISSTRQKASLPTTTRASASSSITTLQQTITSQSQMGTNTVRPVNQMMTGGGLGGAGSISAIGSGSGAGAAGAGSGTGTGAGTVGGVAGGAAGGIGGLNNGGLGGTISGLGGTVGGALGGHH